MNDDSEIVREVRARAAAISERYGNGLRRYAQHLPEIEREHADRVVDQPRVDRSDGERSRPAA